MKKIEMIVKEMNELIEANGLDWWEVRNTLNTAKSHYEAQCGDIHYPECHPTNISEVRESCEMGHYCTTLRAFFNFILDKNEVREFYESMDSNHATAFIFGMWELMLHIGFVDNKYDVKVRTNLETLFNLDESIMKQFDAVLAEIKKHN